MNVELEPFIGRKQGPLSEVSRGTFSQSATSDVVSELNRKIDYTNIV